MSVCVMCNDTKRVQIRVMSFHPVGVVYHFDCPKCTKAKRGRSDEGSGHCPHGYPATVRCLRCGE